MFIDAEDDRDAPGTVEPDAAGSRPRRPPLARTPDASTPRSGRRSPTVHSVPDSKYLINWAWNQLNIYEFNYLDIGLN